MECSCVYSGVDEYAEVYRSKFQKAKRNYQCCECREKILAGEKYEYVFGVWDGGPGTYRTCKHCLSMREQFFCDGWHFEHIWEDLRNFIHDCHGDISESKIAKLPSVARDKMCELIEDTWD